MRTDLFGNNPENADLQANAGPPVNHILFTRIQSLDTLRGIGLLGALFISIWYFGGFNSNQQNGLLLHAKGINYRLWGTVDLLFNGKMRAIISIVFGAGMALYLTKQHQDNKLSIGDLFIRRQMWLMGFGIINAVLLLWPGDMLFHLGLMGILLFPFVRLSARSLLIASIIITLIFSAKNYWYYSDDGKAYTKYIAVTNFEKKIAKDSLLAAQKKIPVKELKKDSLSKQQKQEKSEWEGIVKNKKYDPKKSEEGFKEMRSTSYWKVYDYLLPKAQFREAGWTYQTGIWDFGGMILLGMAIFKFGFFDQGVSRQKYLLLALAGITGGLLLGWFRLQYNQYVLQDYTKYITHHSIPANLFFPFERAFSAVGYAFLVMLLMKGGILKFLWQAFARVGQMALSNYLLQIIICTIFFTGVGMGYFGRLQQYQLYLFVAEICIVQTVFSIIWQRYYYYGPAEWLLRCLVNGKWLPNKIAPDNLIETTTAIS